MNDNARLFLSLLLLLSFSLLIISPVSTLYQSHGPVIPDYTLPEIQIVAYAILHFVIGCVIWLIPENREKPNQVTEDKRP
jgi:hypothetical protein